MKINYPSRDGRGVEKEKESSGEKREHTVLVFVHGGRHKWVICASR
jgi:hypothetical protein